MPANKSRRAASRQAQLSGKGKHARPRGPSLTPSQRGVPGEGQGVATLEGPGVASPSAPAAQPQIPAYRRAPPAARPVRTRAGAIQVLPPHVYFRREVRRIGIVIGVVLIVLVVLTFRLR